jgi:hypothetical protein
VVEQKHKFERGIIGDDCRVLIGASSNIQCGLLEDDPIHMRVRSQEEISRSVSSLPPPSLPQPMRYETFAGVLTVDSPPSTLQGAIMFYDQCVDLMSKKNLAYGDAWRDQGYMGNIARVLSKVSRLRNLMWRSYPDMNQVLDPENSSQEDTDAETVRDTLLDLANLCYFAARNLEEGNQWGS